eukprot:15445777-Alexandrium_andersonii.AAC.1
MCQIATADDSYDLGISVECGSVARSCATTICGTHSNHWQSCNHHLFDAAQGRVSGLCHRASLSVGVRAAVG